MRGIAKYLADFGAGCDLLKYIYRAGSDEALERMI